MSQEAGGEPSPSSDEATRALDTHKTIRSNHTAAKKSIDAAAKWADHLVGEVRAATDVLGQAVDDAHEARGKVSLP